MSLEHAIVEGTLRPDGTLELDKQPNCAPGRVQVIVQPLPDVPSSGPFWQMFKEIWAGQNARGHVPRSAESVELERRELRREWDERQDQIERLQEESVRLRKAQE